MFAPIAIVSEINNVKNSNNIVFIVQSVAFLRTPSSFPHRKFIKVFIQKNKSRNQLSFKNTKYLDY